MFMSKLNFQVNIQHAGNVEELRGVVVGRFGGPEDTQPSKNQPLVFRFALYRMSGLLAIEKGFFTGGVDSVEVKNYLI